MKSLFITIGFMVFAFAKAYSQQPISQDSTAVIEKTVQKQSPTDAVKEFFVYFHKKDTTAIRAMMIDGAALNSLIVSESRGRKTTSATVDDFLKSLASIPDSLSFEERLIQIKTTNSKNIASVNTSYEFYFKDEFTHNGTNVFTLVFIDDKWKVAAIVDTRQYP